MSLLDLLFPKACCGCGKWGSYYCPQCIENITQGDLVCPVCEKPAIGGATHPLCRKKYGLDGLWSLGIYQGSLKKAIKKLKYRFVRDFTQVLIDLMIEYWVTHPPLLLDELKKSGGKDWIVVPVPLHPKRQRWRGFNQSSELGKLLAQKLGLGYKDVLTRTRYVRPQMELKAWQRKTNIKNAFALTDDCNLLPVNYLLVDDVWTTGSTLKECGYILKRGGAKKVWAVTLAR